MHYKVQDVESLLRRDRRAELSLSRQILVYLDPFALFKDASNGPVRERARALSYNREMRWILVVYLRRWLVIAGMLFLAIAPADALAAEAKVFLIPAAALGVGFSVAIAISVLTFAVYLLLGAERD